jgi:NADPH2:quinone reductase
LIDGGSDGRSSDNGICQQKKIKPLIAGRLPLAEVGQAHDLLGKGGVIGKIVLVPNQELLESGTA